LQLRVQSLLDANCCIHGSHEPFVALQTYRPDDCRSTRNRVFKAALEFDMSCCSSPAASRHLCCTSRTTSGDSWSTTARFIVGVRLPPALAAPVVAGLLARASPRLVGRRLMPLAVRTKGGLGDAADSQPPTRQDSAVCRSCNARWAVFATFVAVAPAL